MSEQPVTSAAPGPVGWISELLTRLPTHTFMAGLFVYFLLYVIPNREQFFYDQINQQREVFAAARKEDDERAKLLLLDAHAQCNAAIDAAFSTGKDQRMINTQLLEENQQLLKDLYTFVEKQCARTP